MPDGGLMSSPGKQFLSSTPAAVVALMSAKGAADLYDSLKKDLAEKCGGDSHWKATAARDMVGTYQDRFMAKGLKVYFMSTSTVQTVGGNAGDVVAAKLCYYWLEIKDIAAAPD